MKADNSGRTQELVPKIYNTDTTLKADVKAGYNTFDFELDPKASKIEKAKYE